MAPQFLTLEELKLGDIIIGFKMGAFGWIDLGRPYRVREIIFGRYNYTVFATKADGSEDRCFQSIEEREGHYIFDIANAEEQIEMSLLFQ